MRIICIAVFLTIGWFKSGETVSTSSVTSTTDSTSENTTPSSSESTISSSSDNIISTESSTESLPSTMTDESTMSISTEEVTSKSGTTGSSTTVSTPTVQDTSIDTTTTTNETSETTTTTYLNSPYTSTTDLSTTEEQTTNVTDISNTSTGSTHSTTTDNNTTDLSTTETQTTSTTEYNSISNGSIYSTTTTEEETTVDETSSSSESTVNGTSSESSIYTSTSTEERTSTPRTTTAPPTSTTHISIDQTIHVDTANAIMAVSVNVTFTSCVSEQEASQNMSDALSYLDGFKSVIIETSESCDTRTERTGERSIKKSTFKVFLLAQVLLRNAENTTEKISSTVNSISNVQSSMAFMKSYDMCDSDVCQEAVLKHKGYNCESKDKGNCTLTFPCKSFTCENEGTCTVQANGTHYKSICKCKEDDMYSYSGTACGEKSISWKLWTIIAAGSGGGIIVILLFAVVIICAKRKSASPKTEVYGYDMGYDDRENLMNEPYLSSNEYHRKPLSKDERMEQTNLQTFDNHGYEQWDPSESKDTYASMDKHFQSPSFQTQITRPKIKANKHNDDQLTPF